MASPAFLVTFSLPFFFFFFSHSGADDLARVFTFLLFKAGITNLFTEANIMQDFLTESMTCNEEGYCVTTFIICTQVINKLAL